MSIISGILATQAPDKEVLKLSIQRKAKYFVIKLRGNIDFLTIKQYYERLDWKVVIFSDNSPIIDELNISELPKSKGFVFFDERIKYIFVRAGLSPKDKRNVIIHEAAHIELNHMFSDLTEDAKERDATEFSNVVLRCAETSARNIVAGILLIAGVLLLALLSVHVYKLY